MDLTDFQLTSTIPAWLGGKSTIPRVLFLQRAYSCRLDRPRPAQAHSPPLIMPEALPEGCWPTMITPFTSAGAIDYAVLEALIGELAST